MSDIGKQVRSVRLNFSEYKPFFTAIRSDKSEKCCFECLQSNASWALLPFGVYICLDCAGRGRRLGTHICFVRAVGLDSWYTDQLINMAVGGNVRASQFLKARGGKGLGEMDPGGLEGKLTSRAALEYKEYIAKEIERSRLTVLKSMKGMSDSLSQIVTPIIDYYERLTQGGTSTPTTSPSPNPTATTTPSATAPTSNSIPIGSLNTTPLSTSPSHSHSINNNLELDQVYEQSMKESQNMNRTSPNPSPTTVPLTPSPSGNLTTTVTSNSQTITPSTSPIPPLFPSSSSSTSATSSSSSSSSLTLLGTSSTLPRPAVSRINSRALLSTTPRHPTSTTTSSSTLTSSPLPDLTLHAFPLPSSSSSSSSSPIPSTDTTSSSPLPSSNNNNNSNPTTSSSGWNSWSTFGANSNSLNGMKAATSSSSPFHFDDIDYG